VPSRRNRTIATVLAVTSIVLIAISCTPSTASPSASAPPPTAGEALGGTAWNLAEMGGTADFAHILPTIEFRADGSVSGFAGCNTFSGTYTTDGTTLTMGPLASTEIGCQRPASAVEAEYLGALSGVTSWEIDPAGQLVLGGPVLLRFASR
jgi:heat shock protein HslJ